MPMSKELNLVFNGLVFLDKREFVAVILIWALATHLYFRKYTFAPPNVFCTLGYLLVCPALLSIPFIHSFHSPWLAVFASFLSSYSSLLAITILYRISPFHPLSKFPGPALARVSKFWALRNAASGKQHITFKSLHDTYGPVVRVGPNELSIVNVEAIPSIFGDGMGKGHLWEARRFSTEPLAISSIREPQKHAQRRAVWNKAFSSTALKEYDPLLIHRVQQLVECLEDNANVEIDLTYWFNCYTFDFMGDMMFGGGFELMRDGDKDGLKEFMGSGLRNIALLHTIPWAARILWKIPSVAGRATRLREWSFAYAERRKESGSKVKDVIHHLMNEDSKEGYAPEDIVTAESLVGIVAGSDSTASVLSGIFYYLITNRSARQRLQEEIDTTILPGGDPFDAATLAAMPYLNAVINEVLRLQPPLPIALQRAVLPNTGGRQVVSDFIPEGTAINLPPYVIHRDPRYFSPSPNSFIPERWLGQDNKFHDSKYYTDSNAFIPFAGGFANCVGKNVAIRNIRMVVTILMQRFDMRIAEGYNPKRWEEEMEEYFVLKIGKLPVVVSAKA
ncbi:high nitrogen upregulated cytochrome P450 monooxygenase 2 [Schizopora paradoxa]|uniref:High nitrogen upregulated cytochrome P450 monooxygenase 2 n=1 Tax=Schizopora paradoxa TaxID=27342 RepID=A0A0H2RU78_9AGAM|nr:high nitrogen upregulated cytochrome P450 monooxygenase 2 [Schizopora paradoxa]